MDKMDTQTSVMLIIKDGDKLFFQENSKWDDLSFVGGKYDDADDNEPLRTAYREAMEELDILGGLDFTLEPMTPTMIEIQKLSKRTQSQRLYHIYLFFMRINPTAKKRLEAPENHWIAIKDIEDKKKFPMPISDLVYEILPKVNLESFDSFQLGK